MSDRRKIAIILAVLLVGCLFAGSVILRLTLQRDDDVPILDVVRQPTSQLSTPLPQSERAVDVALGISVAPHLPSRPDQLDALGMTWVKVYQTDQISEYPNQHVLYRIDIDPGSLDGWEQGLDELALELASRGVNAVEIGNEPNLAFEWGGQRPIDPAYFTDALCRAYRVIKATTPDLIIVAGGLAPAPTLPDGSAMSDMEFAQAMFDAGAAGCFDAWGYHPYGFDQPPAADPVEFPMSFRRTELMRELLVANGLTEIPIWITEFGWLRDPAENGVDCSTDPSFAGFQYMTFSADLQTQYTIAALDYAVQNWSWVGPMFLWNLNWNQYDASYEPLCSHLRWYAILNADGSPLPVYGELERSVDSP